MQYSCGIGNRNNNGIKKGDPGDMIGALREEYGDGRFKYNSFFERLITFYIVFSLYDKNPGYRTFNSM
jgi:hypothetical protein